MDKVITKITYNGQEISINIPNLNFAPSNFFATSSSVAISSFTDTDNFYTVLKPATFVGCSWISSISVPNLRKIEPYMFFGCTKLTSISTNKIQKIIPSRVFYNNKLLDISNCIDLSSIERINYNAFSSTYISGDLFLPKCSYVATEAFDRCSLITGINLPICSKIEESAFNSCYSMANINLPQIQEIPNYAFRYCSLLSSINVPNCTQIGDAVFTGCSALTELVFEKVSKVGGNLFGSCPNLKTVKFLYSGNYSFLSWNSPFNGSLETVEYHGTNFNPSYQSIASATIKKIIMPNLTSITNSALFRNYSQLEEVNLDSLSSIATSVTLMYGCSKLKKITLPALSTIGTSAFQNCTNLSQVVLPYPSVMSANTGLFTNTPMRNSTYLGYYGSIYVPSVFVDRYKTATNWALVSDRITSIDNLPQD